MKIKEVGEDFILFDNGNIITDNSSQGCCEENYADYLQIEDEAREVEFDEELIFEEVVNAGFRFGSKGTPMFFIPCYSGQSGYYSSDVNIDYNHINVLTVGWT